MSLYDEALGKIKQNVVNLEQGLWNCIPSTTFGRMNKYLPGILQGKNYIVTANSGVGKTQFTKHYFVYDPYEWIEAHPEVGITLKLLYFALEESKQEFMFGVMCRRLYIKHGIRIDSLELQSLFEKPVESHILDKIEEDAEWYQKFEEKVEVIDTISNPTGIYKYVREYSRENGTHFYRNFKTGEVIDETAYSEMGKNTKGWVYSHYET